MKISLDTPIILNPKGKQTTTVKEVAEQALFTAPQQVVGKDEAHKLYKKISENSTQITLSAEEISTLKQAVDATYIRGVAWQFSEIVDPQDKS